MGEIYMDVGLGLGFRMGKRTGLHREGLITRVYTAIPRCRRYGLNVPLDDRGTRQGDRESRERRCTER